MDDFRGSEPKWEVFIASKPTVIQILGARWLILNFSADTTISGTGVTQVRLGAGRMGFKFRAGAVTGLLLIAAACGAHPASYPLGTGGSFPGHKAIGAFKLTTHLHVVLRSRIRGAIPRLLQYIFMAWYLVKHRDTFTSTLCINYFL